MPAKSPKTELKASRPKNTPASRWISYRPEIKVLDCTIRDGGLMNNHQFPDSVVKAVYDACVAGGVDYMELGYKASRKGIKAGEYGCWKYCLEEDMRRIVGDNPTDLKLCVMADAERWAAALGAPAYAIDDETGIRVVGGAVDVVSEGHWRRFEG